MSDINELSWRKAGNLYSLIKGFSWGGGALVAIALGGILLNIIIGKTYGPAGIGVLTQVMSVFILTAQFGTFGIQLSVLQWVANLGSRSYEAGHVLLSALISVSFPGLLFSVALAFLAQPLENIFQSPDVSAGILASAPGVFFFAFNKVLINYLNACNRLKSVGIFQAVRFILFIILAIGCVFFKAPIWMIGAALASSESLLFILLILTVKGEIRSTDSTLMYSMLKRHYKFGMLSLVGAVVAEINTKVDILVLGIFLSDVLVGIYSIAALVIEGVMHIAHALRLAFNPLLAQAVHASDRVSVVSLLKRMKRLGYTILFIGSLSGIIGYAILINLLGQPDTYALGWAPYLIMCAGVLLIGGYLPLDMILTQAGLPKEQTKLRVVTVCTNLILNFLLIPKLGLNGAAIGTSMSMILSVVYLKCVVKAKLEFSL